MTEPAFVKRERTLLREMLLLIEHRAKREHCTEVYEERVQNVRSEADQARKAIEKRFQTEQESAKSEYEQAREEVASRFEGEHKSIQKEFSEARYVTTTEFDNSLQIARTEHSEGRWTITTLADASRSKAETRAQEIQAKITGQLEKAAALREEALKELRPWLVPMPAEPPATAGKYDGESDPAQVLTKLFATAESDLARVKKSLLIQVLKENRFFYIMGMAAVVAALAGFFIGGGLLMVVAIILAGAGGVGLYFWLQGQARQQALAIYVPFSQTLAELVSFCGRYSDVLKASHAKQLAKLKQKYEEELAEADAKHKRRVAELETTRDKALRSGKERYSKKILQMEQGRDLALSEAEEKYKKIQTASQQQHDRELRENTEHEKKELADAKTWHETTWADLIRDWHDGLGHAQSEAAAINAEATRLYPAWDDAAWRKWQAATETPSIVRFGAFDVDLTKLPNGIPTDPRLAPRVPVHFQLPALLPFPNPCSMVIEAQEDGRKEAEHAVEVVMFRLLAAVPPGKVRFTIVDPIGLGRSFGAFMHLADYDEALVTSRVWTEAVHIEQRLADLTEHMEKVIQKFLRNQFQTIQEYNEQAGEIAEAFRVLVVANFPVNFTPEAMRRLVSIANSGARCGVGILVTVDTGQALPHGFNLDELVQHGVHLVWTDGRFEWKDEDTGRYPFRLDAPPEAEFVTKVLHQVGKAAKLAKRVEVPFEFITPPPDQFWSSHSGSGIDVPLGRSGATKRQHMQLGRGTSQHVLIAGKTGSGKSTLLHAFITNISLMYSPDEVELYLVDFKEGVEFKAYAAHELPHARVVAIESEREFGLSVLQRIEEELGARGDRFRAAGVQDINAYRQLNGSAPLPRILLIVDEFQLFFVEDDKIAQDAALALDRLVRQGRAFGIHVILGSQTLGGAYSLARSTIGQMAVRIALQCSEADAHLILSEDNTAARLLSRPGEAIYNSQNGLVEGNDFFQVVWISDERREHYLKRMPELAAKHHISRRAAQIVFEGKAPSDIKKNALLYSRLENRAWQRDQSEKHAWLGEAMAIKDPTSVTFRTQTGSNVIMVGQLDEPALAIVSTAMIGLATQHPPEESAFGARFYVLDGSPAEGLNANYLARVAEYLPHAGRVGGWRDVADYMFELGTEVTRRVDSHDAQAPAIYLIIYGLQRFRDLRSQEDDFGFGRSGDEKPSPAKLFGTILRDGPAVGVHTFIWCDTMTNVSRAIDRQLLREFEMKILFQMSGSDSSNLIDTPAAARLGLHRALYFTEERGQPEKFRPYGLPEKEWLEWLKARFAAKEPVKVPPAPWPEPRAPEPVGGGSEGSEAG